MDASIYSKTDPKSIMQTALMDNMRCNDVPNVVLIRVFKGGHDTRQCEPFASAIGRARNLYALRSISLIVEYFNNDKIKNVLRLSPSDVVDLMLESDIHWFIAHFHEGNIGKTPFWNVHNICQNIFRLKNHLGYPMGIHINCPA